MRIYKKIRNKIMERYCPLKFAKLTGVNFLEEGVYIYGKVSWGTEPWIITLGHNVHITDGVKFITHDGGALIYRKNIPDLEITKPICIGNDVYIGNNVLILPGVTIGNNVIIGAGATVTKDIPGNSVAAGIPARVIKTADEYLEKIKRESLHLGHLAGEEKDKELMKYYKYKKGAKGIYF